MKRNELSKKALSYSVLAGAVMTGTTANAQINSHTVDTDSSRLLNSSYSIDFDLDGLNDILIHHIVGNVNRAAVLEAPIGHENNMVLASQNAGYVYPAVLDSNDIIEAGDPRFIAFSAATNNGYASLAFKTDNDVYGNWEDTSGFAGISFVAGTGTTHYAWLSLEVDTLIADVFIYAYGYQTTPDSSILAGQEDTSATTSIVFHPAQQQQQLKGFYPSPALLGTPLTAVWVADRRERLTMTLIDLSARKVWSQEVEVTTGENTLTIPTDGIPAGDYFIRFENSRGVIARLITIRS